MTRSVAPRRFRSMAELQAALMSGDYAGKAMHLVVLHDDACTPQHCSCEPEFELEPLTAETYARAQREQAAWAESLYQRRQ